MPKCLVATNSAVIHVIETVHVKAFHNRLAIRMREFLVAK